MKKVLFIFTMVLSALSVQSQTLGDVNNDGIMNIVDALLIARHYVGIPNEVFYPEAADINEDGVINIVDALLAAQYYVDPLATPGPTAYPEEELKKKVMSAWQKWNSSGFRDYSMSYHYYSSMLMYEKMRFLVNLKTLPGNFSNPQITDVIYAESAAEVDPAKIKYIHPIDDLFEKLYDWVKEHYTFPTMEFHPVYGYPTLLEVDQMPDIIDDEFKITIYSVYNTKKAEIYESMPEIITNHQYYINSGLLRENNLMLSVESGGGCRNHQYKLHISPEPQTTQPVQMKAFLEHDNQNDMCMAIITDKVAFDLTELGEFYSQHYGNSKSIQLNIYNRSDSSSPFFTVFYEP